MEKRNKKKRKIKRRKCCSPLDKVYERVKKKKNVFLWP